ncbi:hypothetical protein JHK82_054942 [Glycine max]|nr:hypothetical protein JHK86_054788 [Glycine max]KAG5073583.1 hypothetical protein JHK84_054814 [Glycine max]KAG5076247.1 hypothetical protein JHK82_054942 [Glycine max]
MATQPFRKAIAKPSSSSTPPIPNLSLVSCITSILQNLNPQSPDYSPPKQFSSHHTPNLVINVIKNQNIPHHALHLFNWASNHNHYSHTLFCYAAITDLLLSHSLSTTPTDSPTTSSACSSTLSATAATSGAPFTGHYVYSCNAILGVLMRANCVNIAKAIYDQVLTEVVLELDVYTYTTMICGLCKVGMVESARKVFEEMVSHGMNPDVKAYRVVVVNEYCKIRKPSEAVLLLREMVVRRVKPSMSSFNAVFRVLVDEGKLNKRVILLKQMPKMGCSPNFLFYCTMICGLCKVKGRMQQVEELILDMLQNGHNLDATMYNCLLAGYCQDRDEERTPKIVMT